MSPRRSSCLESRKEQRRGQSRRWSGQRGTEGGGRKKAGPPPVRLIDFQRVSFGPGEARRRQPYLAPSTLRSRPFVRRRTVTYLQNCKGTLQVRLAGRSENRHVPGRVHRARS